MRITRLLTSVIVFFLFSSHVFAQQEPSNDPLLITKPSPALVGIDRLWIDIQPYQPSLDACSLPVAPLKQKVTEKLKTAGIIITGNPSFSSRSDDYFIPVLRIKIYIFKPTPVPFHVFFVQVSLSRIVSFAGKEHDILFSAEVWESEPIINSATEQELHGVLTSAVLQQVDAFISGWSATNTSDVNQPRPQLRKTTADKDTKLAKQQVVEATFVASKNSQVFHKASCPSAKRISPNNLVSYATREQAIAAGKRPCERCNP